MDHKRQAALIELVTLSTQKKDHRTYNGVERLFMQQRIDRLQAKWNFTGTEILGATKASSKEPA